MLSSPASNETTGEVAKALTAYDDKLNPIPRLAESWEWSSDNTKIKLNLRKGVTFHSGREFTSDDVKYNILRVRDPSNGFAAVEWVQGDHILMQRNTNYWDPDLPRVDEYFVQIFRDQQSMDAAFESGTLDVAALAPIPDAVRLKDDPNYQVVSTNDVGQYFYATVNTGVAPTDNKLLRQAIG